VMSGNMAMKADERIERRIKALLAMSRRGTENEREIASRKLRELLDRHDLILDDFDDDATQTYWFSYSTKYERKLLFQVLFLVLGEPRMEYYQRPSSRKIGFDLKKIDFVEVDRLYSHWKRELKVEIKRTFEAFIQVNEIFGKFSGSREELTEEEKAEMRDVVQRMSVLTPSRPFRQIERVVWE